MSTHAPEPPEAVQGDHMMARMLRKHLWEPTNVNNQWRVFVIVGREGSGKSGTMLSILEAVDPSFTAERVHFDPSNFMDQIESMSDEERAGSAIAIDEAGVGMGTRSWYDQEQIQLNKMLQTARDDNMIVGMSLPRLSELDSQMRGRVHAFLEMKSMRSGHYARFKWYFWEPSRDERDKNYRKAPRADMGGRNTKLRSLAIGPPTDQLLEEYEERKAEFKKELYEETKSVLNDGDEDDVADLAPQEMAQEIKEQGVPDSFVSVHATNGTRYIDKDMIQLEYDCSVRDSKKVKKLLERDDEVCIE